MAKKEKRKARNRAFRDVKGSPPSRVKQVRRKKGPKAAERMATAIALTRMRTRK